MKNITLEYLKSIGTGKILSISKNDALTAVRKNGYALRYVHEKTPEICLAAVQQNGYALQYVDERCLKNQNV